MAQVGVQMRLTLGHSDQLWKSELTSQSGQIVWSTNSTPTKQANPASNSRCSLMPAGRSLRSHSPAISPKIMVAIDGTKFNVVYPPWLYSNGFGRGKRLRNHWSKP